MARIGAKPATKTKGRSEGEADDAPELGASEIASIRRSAMASYRPSMDWPSAQDVAIFIAAEASGLRPCELSPHLGLPASTITRVYRRTLERGATDAAFRVALFGAAHACSQPSGEPK